MLYPAIVYKDDDSEYGIVVPDLPGCVSAGNTINEALNSASEAVYLHLEGLVLDGDPVPEPSNIEALQESFDLEEGFVLWASVQVHADKISTETERYNVVLPKWLVAQIEQESETRSSFLTNAASQELRNRRYGTKFPSSFPRPKKTAG